jgi:flavin-dependent thymidylate synthase
MEKTAPRKHVEIVTATERDPARAAALLLFTKATRLDTKKFSYEYFVQQCQDRPNWMMSELDYMSKTIRSSWEFLDVTFTIRDVSRACAQQITRTRFTPIDGDLFGSYAMQSQRVSDMSDMGWHNPHEEGSKLWTEFEDHARTEMAMYQEQVQNGAKLEDARGLLPVNLHCNLIAKYNLRMLVDLVQKRESYRAQGEYNVIAREMREALVEMWPWAEIFLRPKNELAKAAVDDLKASLRDLVARFDVTGPVAHDLMIKLAKVDDILQGE